jgi:tetratricopeptide (TPR) repeat protein
VPLALAASAPAADPCAPWPGEPVPLPTVSDPDDLRQRWASLRARELTEAAAALEAGAPLRAHELWRRALCFDPDSSAALAGLRRTPLVAIHTPAVVTREPAERPEDAWEGLSHPLLLREPPKPAPARVARAPKPAAPDTSAFDRAFRELEGHVRGAQFEAALASAEQGRSAAAKLGSHANRERRAQLEVLAATAALALGRADDAKQSFARALDADPDLALDPVSTPPKVVRALDAARSERGR